MSLYWSVREIVCAKGGERAGGQYARFRDGQEQGDDLMVEENLYCSHSRKWCYIRKKMSWTRAQAPCPYRYCWRWWGDVVYAHNLPTVKWMHDPEMGDLLPDLLRIGGNQLPSRRGRNQPHVGVNGLGMRASQTSRDHIYYIEMKLSRTAPASSESWR